MTPTPTDIHNFYGPHVKAVPAWRVILGTKILMSTPTGWFSKPMSERLDPNSSPVVAVGLNNGIVTFTCANGIPFEFNENSEVLIVV